MRISLVTVVLLTACSTGARREGISVTGGDPPRGAAAIYRYGCGSCHTIGGIRGAHGQVGPELTGLRARMYIGGVAPNFPDNLVRWIQDPKSLSAKTAMPRLDVTAQDATDIAAYLYSTE
jgi:cytochrome c